jgi:diacylglycerol kinase
MQFRAAMTHVGRCPSERPRCRTEVDPKASRAVPKRSGSWNALKSAYHAYSGLLWIAPRTPSLRLGIAFVIALAVVGMGLRLSGIEIALLVLSGTLLLAIETLNTAIEMLCDFVQPQLDPRIGKVKDVSAGATAVTEIGAAIMVAVLLWPHIWAALYR